jgi:hypothetical protein
LDSKKVDAVEKFSIDFFHPTLMAKYLTYVALRLSWYFLIYRPTSSEVFVFAVRYVEEKEGFKARLKNFTSLI